MNAVLVLYLIFLPLIMRPVMYAPEIYPDISQVEQPGRLPPRLRQIDATLFAPNGLITRLQAWQVGERNAQGRYQQFLWNHPTAPRDNVDLAYLDVKPDTARATWRQLLSTIDASPNQPVRMSLAIYAAPCGDGYDVQSETIVDDMLYRRVDNYPTQPGCEAHRAHDWLAIVSVAPPISQTVVITP